MASLGALGCAKRVLAANEAVPFGIFGMIGTSGVFPPRAFLNEFLALGCDPCDQDGRMSHWEPFAVSSDEYSALLAWWAVGHPGAAERELGAKCWEEWAQAMLDL